MAKRRGRRRQWTRTKKRKKKVSASVRRNAKKIKSNRKSIRQLQKDTRFYWQTEDVRVIELVDVSPWLGPGQGPQGPQPYPSTLVVNNNTGMQVATIPFMPLLMSSNRNFQRDAQMWGAIGIGDRGPEALGRGNSFAPCLGNTTNFKWPVPAGLEENLALGPQSGYSKLRHNGGSLKFSLTATHHVGALTLAAGQKRLFRPGRVNVHMFVVSAKAKYADALLKDRSMLPTDFPPDPNRANQNGFMWPANGTMSPDENGATAADEGPRRNEDFHVRESPKDQAGLPRDTFDEAPQINTKLWNIHYRKTCRFGWKGEQYQAVPQPADPPAPLMATPYPPMLTAGAKDPSNLYAEGYFKLPAWGNMYDMKPSMTPAVPAMPPGGGAAYLPGLPSRKVEQPNSMDRNDLKNERMRFLWIFCDGHRPLNDQSCTVQMKWIMTNKYAASQGNSELYPLH